MKLRDEDRPSMIIGLSLIIGLFLFGLLLAGAIRYAGTQVGRGICRSGAGGENVSGVPCP
jgi:hypothetical protein